MTAPSAPEEFVAALRDLHEAAGSPTYAQLIYQASQQKPPVTITESSLSDWLLGNSVPAKPAAVRFLVLYLSARAKQRGHQVQSPASWLKLHDRARRARQASRRGHGGHSLPVIKRPKGRPPNSSTPSTEAAETLEYHEREDGLFRLGEWSPARRLQPSRLLTQEISADARPAQPYIDRRALDAAVEIRSRTASGATVYLTGFRIDHRESDETQYCRILQAPSTYPEVLAIEDLRIQRPELFRECDSALDRNVADYLVKAVPSSLAMNLVIVSSEHDELLCVERSAATDSAVGWWTVGVFETMKQGDQNRPGMSEDLYGLAIRGLNEELGLQPGDYNSIQISWIGILKSILRGHVVAVLKLRISKAELHDRARTAHSRYEHAAISWLPLRRPLVQAFIQAPRSVHPGKVGTTFEIDGRTWIDQSRLAVSEAWRFRNFLES